MKASLLVYDVPAHLAVEELPRKVHPSGFLHPRGVRINLSCWVIEESHVPWAYLDELTQAGVDWKVAEFNPGDAANLLTIVSAALSAEVKQIGESLATSLAKQTNRLDEDHEDAETGDAAEKVRKRFMTATKVAVQRTKRLLKDCEAAAKTFGLGTAQVDEVRAAAEQLKAGCLAKAFMYAQAAKGLADPGLAKAAADGDLPAQVMIDALIDQDDQAGPVASLAAAFAD